MCVDTCMCDFIRENLRVCKCLLQAHTCIHIAGVLGMVTFQAL